MEALWNALWNFITSHWPDVLGGLTALKLSADTYDSLKKMLPEQVETKEHAHAYINDAATLLNDQSVNVEEKQWELDTRRELAESLIRLSAIEATYNIARASLLMAFWTVILHFLMQQIAGTRARLKDERKRLLLWKRTLA